MEPDKALIEALVEIANDILQERVPANEGAARLAAIRSSLATTSSDLLVFTGLDSEWDDHHEPEIRAEIGHDILVAADRFRSRYEK